MVGDGGCPPQPGDKLLELLITLITPSLGAPGDLCMARDRSGPSLPGDKLPELLITPPPSLGAPGDLCMAGDLGGPPQPVYKLLELLIITLLPPYEEPLVTSVWLEMEVAPQPSDEPLIIY